MSSLNQAVYCILDNLLLLNQIGMVKLQKPEKYTELSNKFWLTSTILYLARDIYEISVQIDINRKDDVNAKYKKQIKPMSNLYLLNILNSLYLLFKTHPSLVLDTVKNICELPLPMTSLSFIELSPGVQSGLGLISSVISLMAVWDAKYKLTP